MKDDSGKKRSEAGVRPYVFRRGFIGSAPGSVLVECGGTRVLCSVSVVEGVPGFLDPATQGWLTAEYSMLPASTSPRKARERGKSDSRSLEIQRLVGRSLRAALDLTAFSGMTLYVDCDVLEADGGTRTAAITGGWVALYDALLWLHNEERLYRWPMVHQVAAVSVGVVEGEPVVDLDFALDSSADFDLNVVMDESLSLVEIQGTAEKGSVSVERLNELLVLASGAIEEIMRLQREALGIKRFDELAAEYD